MSYAGSKTIYIGEREMTPLEKEWDYKMRAKYLEELKRRGKTGPVYDDSEEDDVEALKQEVKELKQEVERLRKETK